MALQYPRWLLVCIREKSVNPHLNLGTAYLKLPVLQAEMVTPGSKTAPQNSSKWAVFDIFM